uniref:LRRCT domain-containing protein n=1 Tax=Magallana gigas TaxID=29159 RepID=A0A8W8IZ24_MAGGI
MQNLRLYDNNLTFLTEQIFMQLPNLRNLYIEKNPFECSCDLESFTVFVQTKGLVLNVSSENPKCNSPAYLKGVQIIDVSFKDMGCSTTYETTISIRKTTDLKSTKQTVHSTPMKSNQHTSV